MNRALRMGAMSALLVMLLAGASNAAGPSMWENGSPYVTTLAHAYLAEPVTVISIGQSMRNPLDVHAVLYIASHSDVRAMDLWKRRQQNATHAQLLAEAKIPVASLFTACPKGHIPPVLARAYRVQAESHAKGGQQPVLYNEEIMNLVGLKFCVEVMQLTPQDVCSRLAEGQTMQAIIQAAIEASPFETSREAPITVEWKGQQVKMVPYFAGEPNCRIAVYSPYREGSIAPAGDDAYLMGFLQVKGRTIKGVAHPDGAEGQDLRSIPWFRNMCNRYFPTCRKAGWAGVPR